VRHINEFGPEEAQMQATLSLAVGEDRAYITILKSKLNELVPLYCGHFSQRRTNDPARGVEDPRLAAPWNVRERRLFLQLLGYDRFTIQREVEENATLELERLAGSAHTREASVRRVVEALLGSAKIDDPRTAELRSRADVIGEAARYDYDVALSERPIAMRAALACYVTGGLIVLWLIARQTVAVFRAVGWI
jgi:hypothetical protein